MAAAVQLKEIRCGAATPPPEEKTSRSTLYLGLDWSMSSPAAAARLYSPTGTLMNTWLMCFQQRRATAQETVHAFPSHSIEITEWPMYDCEGNKSRWGVVAHHCDSLFDWMSKIMWKHADEADVKVFIEDYAFGCKKTNSFSKLAEDAGCASLRLFNFLNIEPVPVNIARVKKHWSGSGAATKLGMYEAWKARGLPELRDALRCSPGDNPYSDLVDALAVLEAGRGGSDVRV